MTKPRTPKECLQTRDHVSLPYSIHRKDNTLREIPLVNKSNNKSSKPKRKREITRVCTREELGLPPATNETELRPFSGVPSGDVNLNCELSHDETLFIEEFARRWNLSYEQACDKVIHDGIKLLRESFDLLRQYETTKYNK